MHIILLALLVILLVGQLILRVEQRRLSQEFEEAASEARQAIVLGQAVAANDRDLTDRVASNSSSILQATDRIEAAALVVANNLRAVVPNTVIIAATDRIEAAAAVVASNLQAVIPNHMIIEATDRIEAAAAVVATDLAESHTRANAIVSGTPGEAADAASQKEQ